MTVDLQLLMHSTDYPLARRVLTTKLDGAKRKRTLAAIAAYIDEGHEPSLREIAERAKLKGWKQALAIVKRLESDGLLAVTWVQGRRPPRAERQPRNTYEVLV